MIEAELPDGRILEFPNGTDPTVIQRTVKRVLGVQDQPAQTAPAQAQPAGPVETGTGQIAQPAAQPAAQGAGPQAPGGPLGFAQNTTEALGRRLLETAVNAPEDMINMIIRAANTGPSALLGLDDAPRPLGQETPQVDIPTPDPDEIAAARRTFNEIVPSLFRGELPDIGESFNRNVEAVRERSQARESQAPIATTVGETGADILTLLAARQASGLQGGGAAADQAAATASTTLGKALQTLARSTRREIGNAVETGAEAAFLASIQDADPAEAGAIAAGAQVGSAPFRGVARGLLGSRLAQAVTLGTIVGIGLERIVPGGDPGFVTQNIEERSTEATLALLLGGAAAPLGRIPKGFGGPAFKELTETVTRGTLLSALNSAIGDPERTGRVVQIFGQNPDAFGSKAKRLLTRALNSDKIDVRSTVDNLMEDRQFRRRFEALTAQ